MARLSSIVSEINRKNAPDKFGAIAEAFRSLGESLGNDDRHDEVMGNLSRIAEMMTGMREELTAIGEAISALAETVDSIPDARPAAGEAKAAVERIGALLSRAVEVVGDRVGSIPTTDLSPVLSALSSLPAPVVVEKEDAPKEWVFEIDRDNWGEIRSVVARVKV